MSDEKEKAAELRFEYDQLRKEILLIDTLTLQTLGFILVLTGAIISFAATLHGSLLMKGILFFVAGGIACIGLRQSIDRGSSMYLLSTYLRTFVEPYTEHMQWETRLHEFRSIRDKLKPDSGVYGGFTEYQGIIYVLLIIINFILGSWHVLQHSSVIQNLIGNAYKNISTIGSMYLPIAFIYVVLVVMAAFLLRESEHYKIVVKEHDQYYTPIWEQVKLKEKIRKQ